MRPVGLAFVFLQQRGETVALQQPHVLREHGEQATHQEQRDLFRNRAPVQRQLLRPPLFRQGPDQPRFQRLREFRQQRRDLARDFRGAPGRIQDLGIGPDRSQAFAHGGIAQVLQIDAVRLAVRELGVVLPLQGEVGVKLDHMANIDDDQKRRPALRRR